MKTEQEILSEIKALDDAIESINKLLPKSENQMTFDARNATKNELTVKWLTLKWVLNRPLTDTE